MTKIIYNNRQSGKTTSLMRSCLADDKGLFVCCIGGREEVKRLKKQICGDNPNLSQEDKIRLVNELDYKIVSYDDLYKALMGRDDTHLYVDNVEFIIETLFKNTLPTERISVPFVTISKERSLLDLIEEE